MLTIDMYNFFSLSFLFGDALNLEAVKQCTTRKKFTLDLVIDSTKRENEGKSIILHIHILL